MQRRSVLKALGAAVLAPLGWLGRLEAGENGGRCEAAKGSHRRLGATSEGKLALRLRYTGGRRSEALIRGTLGSRNTFNSRPFWGFPAESVRVSQIDCWNLIVDFEAGSPFVKCGHIDSETGDIVGPVQKYRMHQSADFNTIFKEGEWEVCDA